MYPYLKKTLLDNSGQTLIEYLMVFALFTVLSAAMIKGLTGVTGSNFRSLAYHLTQHLSSGVCSNLCWGSQYENGDE